MIWTTTFLDWVADQRNKLLTSRYGSLGHLTQVRTDGRRTTPDGPGSGHDGEATIMTARRKNPTKRYFGSVQELPSGRWRARYRTPDGQRHSAHTAEGASLTFETRRQAETWLAAKEADIQRGKVESSLPATPRTITFRAYVETWLAHRELAVSTQELYGNLLEDHILPEFGRTPITDIKPEDVRAWYATLARARGRKIKDRPTTRTHAYGLLRTILNTAVADEVIDANPCRIRGAGQGKRVKQIKIATEIQLEALGNAVPPRLRLMILFAGWCALRFGELAELRRKDVDIDGADGAISVERAVVRTHVNIEGGRLVKGPKSESGKRRVGIPSNLIPDVVAHLAEHVEPDPDALLFPSARDSRRQMNRSSLYHVFYPAREAIGRPDLRFHDLRHTGATWAASSGASPAAQQERLGHATMDATAVYMHVEQGEDRVITASITARRANVVTPPPVQRVGKREKIRRTPGAADQAPPVDDRPETPAQRRYREEYEADMRETMDNFPPLTPAQLAELRVIFGLSARTGAGVNPAP